ncbi:MAG: glycosyltransferase family 2 protein [Myxococcota bacterium]|nr:glycosyltransferase family 2 protein [Myxococcota bacterium]
MALVSFVLPTLDEQNIGDSLERLLQHLSRIEGNRFEILLVDDSPDDARERLKRTVAERAPLAGRHETRVIDGARRGKGHAVKLGAEQTRGEYAFVMDADLPVPLERIEGFLAALERGDCEVVMGERPMDSDLSRPSRVVLSRVLFLLQYAIVFQKNRFVDTQCGFKAFRGDTLRSLARRQIVDGGMYDIEYLYVTLLDRGRICRVPVEREPETRPSKINVWRCVYTDPVDLLRIKAHGLAGGYERP